MITRIWHGTTDADKADDYFDYLNRTGITDYRATDGNCGVYVLRRVENGKAHFLLLTFWKSLEAIKNFAGEEIERARYYPEDENFLLELEPFVQHYEVLEKP